MRVVDRSGRPYRRAVAALKARGDIQNCWSCGKTLYADAPRGHPNSITLGHYVALADGGDLLNPDNHGPQCPADNYRGGAEITNRRRRAAQCSGMSYRNPAY